VQDPTVKIPKIEKIPFLLTELEMADLSIFLRKMTFVLEGLRNIWECKTGNEHPTGMGDCPWVRTEAGSAASCSAADDH
jgi:hypothetical protein